MQKGDRFILLLLAAMIAAWGLLGAADVAKRTQAGFTTGADHVIIRIAPGGPAEQVRMREGDRIIRIDGVDIEDTANIVRLPRVAAGERRSYTVTRGDQTIRYRPAFSPLDARAVSIEHLSTIVGLVFLLVPLTACLTRPNVATRILSLMGLGLSLAFFDGPYVASYDLRAVAAVVAELFMLLGIAALIHFLLIFPEPRPVMRRSWGKKLVYIPML
ncbi:MAG: PDZ domain-containing protein, partial [Xanthomonadales bacterium]|nr:PDZ domain-containing protein [Xanthomonadales bacterium]